MKKKNNQQGRVVFNERIPKQKPSKKSDTVKIIK
jgi:hypothetical protein